MKQYATTTDVNQQRWIGDDFESRLLSLISSAPDAIRMEITPSMAEAMLEFNESDDWKNRPKSKHGITRFAKAMREGRWVYTGDTIVFGVNGRLLNGQHRLSACIESGSSFECLVAFGVPDEAFAFYDRGISRTAGHVFAMKDIPHYNFSASALRIVAFYLSSPEWNGSVNQINPRLESDELLSFFHLHPGIVDSQKVATAMSKESFMSPRWAGAMHYLCAMKNKAQADQFFDQVITGLGITDAASPEYLIRKRLDQSAKQSGDKRESDVYLAAYLIQAWNARRNGKKRSIFRWRGAGNPNERFPRAV
jgi:hypothetical protein